MKKFVRIDPQSGRFLDIDPKKLARDAKSLGDFVRKNIDPANDALGIYTQLLPLCDKVAKQHQNQSIPLDELPLRYPFREGLFPTGMDALYSEFSATITGTPLDVVNIVDVNGVPCAEVEFED
ncbi:hypothetical protein [Microbulbifer agarilyticus]|uniref:hypothetical protein n=1 Tax=Microbulbifer agarilyticus TaxID=260552 RepID=UPI001CD4454C|nr:hypothetical protein [Microbulbifer agarilyticus]MCA0893463.1 hypothetical protein [Microbulbifer agarilyticus]